MGNFAEVLANNQTKNINIISNEIGKKLENFNGSLIAHKAKNSTGVASISINPNKTKAMGLATISVKPKSTSRANVSVEDDGDNSSSSHDCQEEDNDARNGKRKCVTNLKVNKKVIRETGDSHPLVEDELSLYGGSDLDEQIDRLVDMTNSPKVHFANDDESEPEESDEDDLINDIASDFSAVEKTDPPIGKKLASIINNVMFNPVNKEKLVQKLGKHHRPENLNSLKMKKCNPEIWSEMVQSKTRSNDLKTQKMQSCLLKAVGAISKVTNTLLDLKNRKSFNATTLNKNLSTMVHDCTDSLTLLNQVNAGLEQNRCDHIAYCLDNQYHTLRKNVPTDSEFLFGDDLPKRIMNFTANKKLFSSSKTSFQSYKSSKNLCRFPQNPGNRTQNGYQNRTGQYQKQYNSSNSNKHPKQKKH